ncbi:MAG: PH domain-containing protein [Steroidobacteraceae bacterium]
MSYVDSNLLPGEQVTFRTHLSLVIFTVPLALAVLALAFYLIGPGTRPVGHLFLLGALAAGAVKYFNYATSEFAVTNKRIIIKVGFLKRRTLEMQVQKVETVAVNQGIGARILDYGDILVTGTGGTKEAFRHVSAPSKLRHAVQAASV